MVCTATEGRLGDAGTQSLMDTHTGTYLISCSRKAVRTPSPTTVSVRGDSRHMDDGDRPWPMPPPGIMRSHHSPCPTLRLLRDVTVQSMRQRRSEQMRDETSPRPRHRWALSTPRGATAVRMRAPPPRCSRHRAAASLPLPPRAVGCGRTCHRASTAHR